MARIDSVVPESKFPVNLRSVTLIFTRDSSSKVLVAVWEHSGTYSRKQKKLEPENVENFWVKRLGANLKLIDKTCWLQQIR